MTTIDMTDPEMRSRYLAATIRGHCRMVAVGMAPRGGKTQILKMAGNITGVTYKRGQHAQAADDLTTYLEGFH